MTGPLPILRFINNSTLGFDKELMLVIDVNVGKARSNFEWMKTEMAKVPAMEHVSVTSRVPGEWKKFSRVKAKPEGNAGEYREAYAIGADKGFLPTYDIQLLEGRNFQSENDTSSIIVNETAARMLGITCGTTMMVFALAGIITTGIAMLTVSYQAIRAALVSPVKILKAE